MTEHETDEEVRAHFDHRAAEYDDWWLGIGSFAESDRPGWSEEVDQLIAVVRALPPARVLDVACGTGFLTQHLRGDVVAIDQSGPMVEIAAARMPHAQVRQGEAIPLQFGDGEFDRVFTSHFFHHVPPDRRAEFVAEAGRVGRELVVVEGPQFFESDDLAHQLGDARVLHEDRWFTVVAS